MALIIEMPLALPTVIGLYSQMLAAFISLLVLLLIYAISRSERGNGSLSRLLLAGGHQCLVHGSCRSTVLCQ